MLRLAQPLELEEADPEESVTVAVAARRLGCDESTVRAMLNAGELEGFRVGKCKRGRGPGGVRIQSESIRLYKERHRIGAAPANDAGKRRRVVHTSGHTDAMRWLRSRGIVP